MKVALIAAATLLVAGPALAQDVPKLTGTWSAASSDGMSMQFGHVDGAVKIVVGEQTGRSFKAEVTFPGENGPESEPLLGTIAPDGKTVILVGNDGYHLATLQSATVLDHCYMEASDDDALVACGRLEKQ